MLKLHPHSVVLMPLCMLNALGLFKSTINLHLNVVSGVILSAIMINVQLVYMCGVHYCCSKLRHHCMGPKRGRGGDQSNV